MKICALIKYPPIQGGVSARSFWLARGLAALGHEVHVVTHADLVESNYRIELLADDLEWLEYDPEGPGRVRLVQPQRDSRLYTHIPQGSMHTERLAALATRTVRAHQCDIIISYYFQPFGMAAHLASQWTGVPYTVQHAGSDLGRLMNQPDVYTAYQQIITQADAVLSGSPRCFVGMGVENHRIYRPPSFALPDAHFGPEVPALDLRAHIDAVGQRRDDIGPPADAFDQSVPTVGIYGKLGESKGSYDLLEALARLRTEGLRFNFVAMTSGRELDRYRQALVRHELVDRTWVLPFIPHHKVPGFIRACDVVTFLERDFPITFHTPTIPTEILSCGTCLVLSKEIADKQPYRDRFRSGENLFIVDDPKDHDELTGALRTVLSDPGRAAAVGLAGARIDKLVGTMEDYSAGYAEILEDVLRVRSGEPSQIPLAGRSVSTDRSDALKELAYPLWLAFEDAMNEPLRDYLVAYPEAETTAYRDASRFCRYLVEMRPPALAQEAWADTLRLTTHLVWLGLWSEDEALSGPFVRRDAQNLTRPGWLDTAPLRTRWLRLESFAHLPPTVPWNEPEGPVLLAFHKQPNMRGSVFKINASTHRLLERCDGTTSCRRLTEEFAAEQGPAADEIACKVGRSLRWWYTRGLITFVDRADR